MGSFSWTRAEATTRRSNLSDGDKYKILVPSEFGGGYIRDIYEDYGYVFWHPTGYSEYIDAKGNVFPGKGFAPCDLYGILAYWNECHNMSFNGSLRPVTMVDVLRNGRTYEQDNRCAGIKIGCYDDDIDKLKFPLKLVSASYSKSYEECCGVSYGDPNQGFFKANWRSNDYQKYLRKLPKEDCTEGILDKSLV